MNRDPIWNNIIARLTLLGLVADEFPDLHGKIEGLKAITAYEKRLSELGIERNLCGYARVTLNQTLQSAQLMDALRNWARRFNLEADWVLDHLLETIAHSLARNDTALEEIAEAWWTALVEQNQTSRWAMYGPRITFRYTWPNRISLNGDMILKIEATYQNPLQVLSEDFLRDIQERFATFIFQQLSSKSLEIESARRWSVLEEIADEIRAFNRKLTTFRAKARKDVQKYQEETKGVRSPHFTGRPVTINGTKIGRNIRWLLMYQVKGMSYGAITKAENEVEKTVIDGVKAASRLIDLQLRAPNKAGRKRREDPETS